MRYVYASALVIMSLTCCINSAQGQVETTMHFMKSLPQVTYFNPAFKPEYKFSFGLPGSSVFAQFSNNGFTYNDFVSRQNNLLTADLNKLYGALRERNFINANAQADLFRFSLKASPRLYLTTNVTLKAYSRVMMPRDLVGLFINGTDAYVNNTASLSPEAEAISYAEIGWGAAYTVNRKLTVGAKVKLLKGAINVNTRAAKFDLSLSNTYAITAVGEADVRTSGVKNLDDPNYDIADDWNDFLKNSGIAIDLGATYRYTDRLTFGFSIIDLGSITWKNNTYGYKLDPTLARYTFEGVDINDIINGDTDYAESLADSLEKRFDFTEGQIGKYRTPLPGKVYASASYQLKRNLYAGGVLFFERFRGRTMSGITASINKEFGRRMGASLSYTITNNSFNNLGAGVSFNFAPIQFYIVGDNLLRVPLSYMANGELNGYLNNLQYFTIRTGINFIFGRDKVEESRPTPKSSAR